MSLTAIQEALAGKMRGIDGVRKAPDYPPESLNAYPFVVIYPSSGEERLFRHGRQLAGGTTTWVIELHVSSKDLARRIEELLPYREKILDALRADMTLGISNCRVANGIDWSFGGLPAYGGVETIGFSFSLTITHEN